MKGINGHKYNAVGCHIYAGGFTIGVAQHFNILAHLEQGMYGVESFQMNFGDVPVFVKEDGAWQQDEVARRRVNGVDFIYGNPPCAAFSGMNPNTGNWRNDPRINCARAHFGNLLAFKPQVFVYESVCGAWTRGRELMDEFAAQAVKAGYSVTHFLHSCAHMKVPQKRKRYFFIAHKVWIDFLEEKQPKIVTVGEALAKVKDPGWIHPNWHHVTNPDLVRLTVPGKSLADTFNRTVPEHKRKLTKQGKVQGRPINTVYRLKEDEPAGTVVGYFMIHPTEDRPLGLNEYRALCTYPQKYQFEGNEGHHVSYMARAVSPNVGSWLAKRVFQALESSSKIRKPRVSVVDARKWPATEQELIA